MSINCLIFFINLNLYYILFTIIHEYDTDGGFGDAIRQQPILGYVEFDNEENCKKWCEENSNTHIYDTPYQNLYTGTLSYKIVELTTIDKILPEYWWNNQEDDYDSYLDEYEEE